MRMMSSLKQSMCYILFWILCVDDSLCFVDSLVDENRVVYSQYAVDQINSSRNLFEVGQLFEIPPPYQFQCENSFSFVLRFDVSDYILDDMLDIEMYAKDDNDECTIDITDNQYLAPTLIFDQNPVKGNGNCTRQVAIAYEADINLLPFSDIYFEPNGGATPYISFCTKLNIYTETEPRQQITWVDIEFIQHLHLSTGFNTRNRLLLRGRSEDLLRVDDDDDDDDDRSSRNERQLAGGLQCSGGYDVVFEGTSFCGDEEIQYDDYSTTNSTQSSNQTSPSGGSGGNQADTQGTNSYILDLKDPFFNGTLIEAASEDSSYGVIAYLCSSNLDPIDSSEVQIGPSTFNVCIERNENSVRDGVFLRQIDAFIFYRDGTGTEQNAIELGGRPADNGLTRIHCTPGSHKCWFETYLMLPFFHSDGYIYGVGAATLQFGDDDTGNRIRRKLQDSDDISKRRRIQLEFPVAFQTKQNPYGNAVHQRNNDQKDQNWLRYGLSAIGFLLGLVLIFEFNHTCCKRWDSEELSLPTTKSDDVPTKEGFIDTDTFACSERTTTVGRVSSSTEAIANPIKPAQLVTPINTSNGTVMVTPSAINQAKISPALALTAVPMSGEGTSKSQRGRKMTESPKRFDDVYHLAGVLCTGAFSTVREGHHRSNSSISYAVKCVERKKLSKDDEDAMLVEVSILMQMKHKHIIRLYEYFKEPEAYYLIMEQVSGGELFNRIVEKSQYNEKEARDTCLIILEAVAYMHGKHVAHRDLKPENLLLLSQNDDSAVKIADFGFAKKVYKECTLTTQCGTPGYAAPEILSGAPYDWRVDMWSVGVILYILLGGYAPFAEPDHKDLYRKVKKGDYEFHDEHWGTVSVEAKELISSLLTVNPKQRLTAKKGLKNKWIRLDDASLAKRDLGQNLQEFRRFTAKRKFKAAVSAVIAANKLNALAEMMM